MHAEVRPSIRRRPRACASCPEPRRSRGRGVPAPRSIIVRRSTRERQQETHLSRAPPTSAETPPIRSCPCRLPSFHDSLMMPSVRHSSSTKRRKNTASCESHPSTPVSRSREAYPAQPQFTVERPCHTSTSTSSSSPCESRRRKKSGSGPRSPSTHLCDPAASSSSTVSAARGSLSSSSLLSNSSLSPRFCRNFP